MYRIITTVSMQTYYLCHGHLMKIFWLYLRIRVHIYFSITEGEVQVIIRGELRGTMGPGKLFGELALLYNCTRTATIKALTDTKVYTCIYIIYNNLKGEYSDRQRA